MSNPGVGADEDVVRSHAGGPSGPTGVASTHRSLWYRALQAGTAVAALGVVILAGILIGNAETPPAPVVVAASDAAVPDPTPTPTPVVPAPAVTAPAAIPQAPVDAPPATVPALQVSIPDIEIDQPMIELGIMADGRLEAPADFDAIGWWSDGPAPGDPGAAIVVGHVNSVEGPAVFSELGSLQVGDVVSFQRADGTLVRFAVTGTQVFPKNDFPDDLVYRVDGKPSVHLVTCGGVFDRATGHYRDNVVVFADLIDDATGETTASAVGTAHRAETVEEGTR